MLPETYKQLNAIAQADEMRLGAWLDAKAGTDLRALNDGLTTALRPVRLQQVVKSIVILIGQLDDLLNEDTELIKDDDVVAEMRELARALPYLREALRDAGLAGPRTS